ncbi:MAG: hypothetical protein OES32_03180 [Acidobacteriota bacterium]|nr:hypothetical protein [Acidobacteriota bacterium]MDH3522565.1 hypothetical protein [Acidobacteriota bacterium]
MTPSSPPRHAVFDPTPEIFATDAAGAFWFPLLVGGHPAVETHAFDEVRLMISLWYPSSKRTIDLDSAYVELRGLIDPGSDHWCKLAEIEPVVPAYNAGQSFDGWIVLPIFSTRSTFGIAGHGFEARARVQIRASAYFVA